MDIGREIADVCKRRMHLSCFFAIVPYSIVASCCCCCSYCTMMAGGSNPPLHVFRVAQLCTKKAKSSNQLWGEHLQLYAARNDDRTARARLTPVRLVYLAS